MKRIHDLVYSTEVLDFVKSAKEFVDFLNDRKIEDRKEFISLSLHLLPALYSRMMNLPVNKPVFDELGEKFVTEEEWSSVYQYIYGILGSQNEYLDLPEEDEYDRLDTISRDLSEDLADIYQDIRDFLEAFRIGTEEVMNDALWECRINFENYWGKKLLRASLNLHKSYLRDTGTLDKMDKEFKQKQKGRRVNADEWFLSRRQNEQGGESNLSD